MTTGGTAIAGFPGPQRWPDVVASLQWNFPDGALYASGMIGQRFVDSGGHGPLGTGTVSQTSRHDNAFVWGGALGGRYQWGRVELGFNGGIGEGIGDKYWDGGATGFRSQVLVLDTTNVHSADLRNVLTYGVLGYVQVKLTDTIRATGSYNWAMHEVASEVPFYYGTPAVNSKAVLLGVVNYYVAAHGNILWNPVPQVTLGAEYTWQFASRYHSANTSVQRLQFSAIYRF
jgi:hypothetical protein